jgi:hypothetical protein
MKSALIAFVLALVVTVVVLGSSCGGGGGHSDSCLISQGMFPFVLGFLFLVAWVIVASLMAAFRFLNAPEREAVAPDEQQPDAGPPSKLPPLYPDGTLPGQDFEP